MPESKIETALSVLAGGIGAIIIPGRLPSSQPPEQLTMTPEQIRQTCALLILAGGKSSRMGRPKAWLPFHGQPMLARVLDRLAPLFEERVVVRAPEQDLPEVDARFVEDEEPGMGPVAGLAVGLGAVTRPLAFAVSCDAPFVDTKIVAHLVERC